MDRLRSRALAGLAAGACAIPLLATPSAAAVTRVTISAVEVVQGDQLLLRVKSTQKSGYCALGLAGSASRSLGRVKLGSGAAAKRVGTATLLPGSYYLTVRCGKQTRVRSKSFAVVPPPPVLPQPTPAAELQLSRLCELRDPSGNNFGFSFPSPSDRLPATGTVRGIMLFVDFTDLPGKDSPAAVAPGFVTKFEQFYAANSYGKLKLQTDVYPDYIHIPFDSLKYGMDQWGQGDPWNYFSDAIAAADSLVDFSQYQAAYVLPPAEIKTIVYGPSFPGGRFNPAAQTAEGPLSAGLVGGADQRTASTGWIWLSHEFGHDLGMEHQYLHDGTAPGVWDLMDNVYMDKAPELFAWNRWRLGWLDPSQVRCLTSADATAKPTFHKLTPVEQPDAGSKLLLIRIDQAQAIAVESRHNAGFDHLLPGEEGVLVYLVDVTRQSNEGAIRLVPGPAASSYQGELIGTLTAGQSVTVAGISITVLDSGAGGELLSVGAAG